MKKTLLLSVCLCVAMSLLAKDYTVLSPDGSIAVTVGNGAELTWSVSMDGVQLLCPSRIALTLSDGTVYGHKVKVKKALRKSVDQVLDAPVFKRSKVRDSYNELTLRAKDFDIVFRVADDGAAYRFVTKKGVTVKD